MPEVGGGSSCDDDDGKDDDRIGVLIASGDVQHKIWREIHAN